MRVWKKLVEADDDAGQLGVGAAAAAKPAQKIDGFGVREVRGSLHEASRGGDASEEDSLALHPAMAQHIGDSEKGERAAERRMPRPLPNVWHQRRA